MYFQRLPYRWITPIISRMLSSELPLFMDPAVHMFTPP
jgi:hypothetical protein